jgi:hypothetical protein
MPKISNEPEVTQVTFRYVGTDENFNLFLKSIIHDYISNEINDDNDDLAE